MVSIEIEIRVIINHSKTRVLIDTVISTTIEDLALVSQFPIFHKERHDITNRIIRQALRSSNDTRNSNDLKLPSLVFEPQ